MSYLTLPVGIPDFSKAVISLWFRVPQESITKAGSAPASPAHSPILLRTIPLLTFGKRLTSKRNDVFRENVRVDHWDTGVHGESNKLFTITPNTWVHIADDPIDPCYIGLHCADGKANLKFNIQMDGYATVADSLFDVIRQDRYLQNSMSDPGTGIPGSNWIGFSNMFAQSKFCDLTSLAMNAWPEYFQVESRIKITPDAWHHLLLSFDLSDNCVTFAPPPTAGPSKYWNTIAEGTSSYCRLWYAIDDVDYRGGQNMLPFPVDYKLAGDGGYDVGDPNGILTDNAWNIAADAAGGPGPWNHFYPSGTCNYESQAIPSHDAELGIPASKAYVDNIYMVEMAEFQMWTGVSLDTGSVQNRRAFIDADGKPVMPKIAEARMGRRPTILLHGSSNWKKGKNRGSSGINNNGDIIVSGQFQPTARIEAYKPEPSLHGPQVA